MLALTALTLSALFAGMQLQHAAAGPVRRSGGRWLAVAAAGAAGILACAAWYRWQSNPWWLAGGIVALLCLATYAGKVGTRPGGALLRAALGIAAAGLIARGLLP